MLDDFLALGQILTAADRLDENLAQAYLEAVQALPGNALVEVLAAFNDSVRSSDDVKAAISSVLLGDPLLAPTVKQILLLWMTGTMLDPATGKLGVAVGPRYLGAMMWDAVGAHPPGLTNGYFGHWKYPSDVLGLLK